jgi:hypothetical protein
MRTDGAPLRIKLYGCRSASWVLAQRLAKPGSRRTGTIPNRDVDHVSDLQPGRVGLITVCRDKFADRGRLYALLAGRIATPVS